MQKSEGTDRNWPLGVFGIAVMLGSIGASADAIHGMVKPNDPVSCAFAGQRCTSYFGGWVCNPTDPGMGNDTNCGCDSYNYCTLVC